MNRIKLYFVRKWLYLIPATELEELAEHRHLRDELDAWYEKLANSMLELLSSQ